MLPSLYISSLIGHIQQLNALVGQYTWRVNLKPDMLEGGARLQGETPTEVAGKIKWVYFSPLYCGWMVCGYQDLVYFDHYKIGPLYTVIGKRVCSVESVQLSNLSSRSYHRDLYNGICANIVPPTHRHPPKIMISYY